MKYFWYHYQDLAHENGIPIPSYVISIFLLDFNHYYSYDYCMDPEVNSDGASSGLKFLLLEVTIVGVIILTALFILNYFSILSLSSLSPSLFSSLPQKSQTTPSTVTFPSPSPDSSNTILAPIATNNPNVISSAILYNLKGVIETIETQNNVTTITLQQVNPVIPPISLLGNTTVKRKVQSTNGFDQAKIEDLKNGQEITFSAVFDPTTQTWKGYSVTILANTP